MLVLSLETYQWSFCLCHNTDTLINYTELIHLWKKKKQKKNSSSCKVQNLVPRDYSKCMHTHKHMQAPAWKGNEKADEWSLQLLHWPTQLL